MYQLSVIAPCFNEADNIKEFYYRSKKTLENISPKINFEIIFIDDGSTDNTWKIIKNLKKDDVNFIQAIKFTRNFGHQNAILSGLKKAKGEYIALIDVDLQQKPEMLSKLYNDIISSEYQVISFIRKKNKLSIKNLLSDLFYNFFNFITKHNIKKNVSDFKIFNRNVLKNILSVEEQNIFIRGIIPWIGFREKFVEYDVEIRKKGKSGWDLSKQLNFALDAIFGFSNYPMRLSFLICFMLTIIFFMLGIYALFSYFNNQNIKGWTSLFMVLVFFNIFNFFILGLISEYTGRIYYETKKRPRYIIDEEL